MPLPFISDLGDAIWGRETIHKSDEKRFLEEIEMKRRLARESLAKELDTLKGVKSEIHQELKESLDMVKKVRNFPPFGRYKKNGLVLSGFDSDGLENYVADESIFSVDESLYWYGYNLHAHATPVALGIPAIISRSISRLISRSISIQEIQALEQDVNSVCDEWEELKHEIIRYTMALNTVKDKHEECFRFVSYLIDAMHKTDWNCFSEQEKAAMKNQVLLVAFLRHMCQVDLVIQADNTRSSMVNRAGISKAIRESSQILSEVV